MSSAINHRKRSHRSHIKHAGGERAMRRRGPEKRNHCGTGVRIFDFVRRMYRAMTASGDEK